MDRVSRCTRSVASLTVHMWRTARKIKSDIEGHLQQASARNTGAAAWLGVSTVFLLSVPSVRRMQRLRPQQDGDRLGDVAPAGGTP